MRRCRSKSCELEASSRQVNLEMPVANLLLNPKGDWRKIANYGGRKVARNIEVDWGEYTTDNYLFTHVTIVSSVETEANGFHIKPACSDLVNNNGNSWSNEVLLSTFRSFVGGENYVDHIQKKELSKGKILDAVARPVVYESDKGDSCNVYFIDILVATKRVHQWLVGKIESGDMSTMSMGCLCDYVTCSQCGNVYEGSGECDHIQKNLTGKFYDSKGIERIVSEMCGRTIMENGVRVGDSKSVEFIEASWVDSPAFKGAILNHYLDEIPKTASFLALQDRQLEECVSDLFKMRVADKTGMASLIVARNELMRRRHAAMVAKVEKARWH